MAIGWFDFFREDGAPTWYGENRTPVVVDLKIAIILSIFVIPTLAFLIILPGIRRNRCVSTFTFLYSMAVGATLLVTIHHPCWHQGKVHIYSLYRKDSSARLDAVMGVSVGLHHVNITFTSSSSLDADAIDAVDYDRPANPPPLNLNYNERFEFSDVRSMERELELSMKKGLPYPILRVIEYLSVDRAGFVWGRQYRLAGYYASILLWVAFSCWLLQFLLLCIVPHQYAQMTVWVGAVILLADLVYAINTPNHLHIRFPGPRNEIAELDFHFSTCFYSTLIAGICSVVYGSILCFLQSNTSFVFTTFLSSELDEMCVARKTPRSTVDSPTHTVSSCGGCGRTTVMEMFAVASIRSQGSAASFQSTIS
uniref:Dual oxidase maturation factor 2 n=1 Tax=Steinernema glaseri TaxID=37863 RepID=A0A1I7Y5I6_9BILA